MQSTRIGEFEVHRIAEFEGPFFPPAEFFPDFDPEVMRAHVISDVHGRAGDLRAVGAGADALFCLGDLLLFVDYSDEAQGIFAELFGVLLVADLVQYWTHRAYHEVPFLWRFHAVHHSAEYMDWMAGSRLHLFELLTTRVSILGVLPFTLALPYVNLFMTDVLAVIIGLLMASAFPAILVYAQELVPGRVGMIAGIFFCCFGASSTTCKALFGSLTT